MIGTVRMNGPGGGPVTALARRCKDVVMAVGVLVGVSIFSGIGISAAQAADPAIPVEQRVLRVCADPDNLPFSKSDGSGFENRIAQLVASDLGLSLQYEWLPDRRGFVRKTLGAELCDVIIGVPVGFERAMTTKPYYRSSYAVVQRQSDPTPAIERVDDPRLANLRIGVQLIGNDQAPSPPGLVVARKGWIENVEGFMLNESPPSAARMITALASGAVDVAMIWGPQAGWHARRSAKAMRVRLVGAPDDIAIPFEFSIAMGVRRSDKALMAKLDEVIARRRADIEAILDGYAVPRLPLGAAQ